MLAQFLLNLDIFGPTFDPNWPILARLGPASIKRMTKCDRLSTKVGRTLSKADKHRPDDGQIWSLWASRASHPRRRRRHCPQWSRMSVARGPPHRQRPSRIPTACRRWCQVSLTSSRFGSCRHPSLWSVDSMSASSWVVGPAVGREAGKAGGPACGSDRMFVCRPLCRSGNRGSIARAVRC